MSFTTATLTRPCACATTLLCLAIFASGVASQELSPDIQPLDTITDSARAFVLDYADGGDREAVVNRLDPRLRLPLCSQPLQAFWPPGARRSGSSSVGVRCAGERPWKLFVPVRIAHFADVVVSARPLSRGQTLSADDVRLERRDVTRLGGRFMSDLAQVAGWRVRRPARAGEVLSTRQLEIPKAVERGQTVVLHADAGSFSIRAEGVALEGGGPGELVRVRNNASGRTLEGLIVAPGIVRIPL